MVSIIIPTYNEALNVKIIAEKIYDELIKENISYELLIVDDNSPDKSWEIAQNMDKKFNIRVIRRLKNPGLSKSVGEGFSKAKFPILVVMDCDLSHPVEALAPMIRLIKSNTADIVVGSRHVNGGNIQNWGILRKFYSFSATLLTKPLINIADPMSGFLCMKKEVIKDLDLSIEGFKIGLEILIKGNYSKLSEYPIVFTNRVYGQSKLGRKVIVSYFKQVINLYRFKVKKKAGFI